MSLAHVIFGIPKESLVHIAACTTKHQGGANHMDYNENDLPWKGSAQTVQMYMVALAGAQEINSH